MKTKSVKSFVLYTLLLMSCNASPTQSGDIPMWLQDEWKIGQNSVKGLIGSEAYSINPEQFSKGFGQGQVVGMTPFTPLHSLASSPLVLGSFFEGPHYLIPSPLDTL